MHSTKMQISLCIRTARSAPVLFAVWKVLYINTAKKFELLQIVSAGEQIGQCLIRDRFSHGEASFTN